MASVAVIGVGMSRFDTDVFAALEHTGNNRAEAAKVLAKPHRYGGGSCPGSHQGCRC